MFKALLFIGIVCLSLSADVDVDNSTTATLLIFSGRENLSILLTPEQENELESLLSQNDKVFKPNYNAIGYRGFQISKLGEERRIVGAPLAEIFLLGLFKNYEKEKLLSLQASEESHEDFDEEFTAHIMSEINSGHMEKTLFHAQNYAKEGEQCGNKNFGSEKDFGPCVFGHHCTCDTDKELCICHKDDPLEESFESKSLRGLSRGNCDRTPMRGPDTTQPYNPKTDNGGCYLEKQSRNNCYNYGTDVLTNTFAQPGKQSRRPYPQPPRCDPVKQAAISDGLRFVNNNPPPNNQVPRDGQGLYVALRIAPNRDYHWVRLDKGDSWSHKGGGGPVTNLDSSGKLIKNAKDQPFGMWSQYCCIMGALPSRINIS